MAAGKYYLTTGPAPRGRRGLLAIISKGQPQLGDEQVTICSVEIVANQEAAQRWYERMLEEKPWEPRQ